MIYERIETLCKEKGIKITNFCIEITKSPGNLIAWKKDSFKPVILIKIADFFNVSVDYLLGRNKNMNTKITKEDVLSPQGEAQRRILKDTIKEKLEIKFGDMSYKPIIKKLEKFSVHKNVSDLIRWFNLTEDTTFDNNIAEILNILELEAEELFDNCVCVTMKDNENIRSVAIPNGIIYVNLKNTPIALYTAKALEIASEYIKSNNSDIPELNKDTAEEFNVLSDDSSTIHFDVAALGSVENNSENISLEELMDLENKK